MSPSPGAGGAGIIGGSGNSGGSANPTSTAPVPQSPPAGVLALVIAAVVGGGFAVFALRRRHLADQLASAGGASGEVPRSPRWHWAAPSVLAARRALDPWSERIGAALAPLLLRLRDLRSSLIPFVLRLRGVRGALVVLLLRLRAALALLMRAVERLGAVVTPVVVRLGAAFGLFLVRLGGGLVLVVRRLRRSRGERPADEPAEGGAGGLLTGLLDEVPEEQIPRWRRPSVLAGRRGPDSWDERVPLSFRGLPDPGVTRRRVHYLFVQLTDAPDELRARPVGHVQKGDEVEILQKEGAYRFVRTTDGTEGWLHGKTLQPRRTDTRASEPSARQPRRTRSPKRQPRTA